MRAGAFLAKGWCRFEYDEALARWAASALAPARAAVLAPGNAEWLRCGGTWFVGVNALPNDAAGAVPDGVPLAGKAIEFIHEDLGLRGFDWDRAQVSVVYPDYPRPMPSEPAAAYRYRREHDAAHVDGVLRTGSGRRRHLGGHHRFILGIPLVPIGPGAAPLVVWEGSHEIVRRAFRERFAGIAPADWHAVDITRLYHAVRREIFAACGRVEVVAQPGESYLVHRLALHGITPWSASAASSSDGRMIAYFRPEMDAPDEWLFAP